MRCVCRREAKLEKANMQGTFLNGAKMSFANCQSADMTRADFGNVAPAEGSKHSGPYLEVSTILSGANFKDAKLTERS